jgi:hypothetical protein
MHNTMELLKQIKKTKFLIPHEQLYIQSHHHHKHLIPEQNSGEYNPTYNWLKPETCGGLRHNKVILKVKVY